MTRVLVTGASGFIGSALVARLRKEPGVDVVAGVRRQAGPNCLVLGNLEDQLVIPEQLQGFTTVVHAAARVHVMQDSVQDPLLEYRRVNVNATLALATTAAAAGVRRFLFLSSIKVNGESTGAGAPFRADDPPSPQDAYALSKLEAEQGLLQLALRTGMEVVIVRPPLVYGPGVGANFRSMLRWLNTGIPIPLGGIENHRSLVALDNLVDLLVCCLDHPAAAGQVFLVSDDEDFSTTELLRYLGQTFAKPVHLWRWTGPLLRPLLSLLRRDALITRLYGSLQLDISKTRKLLGWTPPVEARVALRRTAEHFQQEAQS